MLTSNVIASLKQISDAWPQSCPEGKADVSKWFSADHEKVFTRLLSKKPNGLYLELGTWTGVGSTAFVANKFPNMTLICIDTFKGSSEHQRDPKQKRVAEKLWDHFCINRWIDRDRIYPIKAPSVEALQRVDSAGLKPDFIYVDAAHEADAVFADVSTAIKLFPQAVLLGDDYVRPGQGHPGVYLGIDKAVKEKLIKPIEFKTLGRVWYLTCNLK